MTVLLLLKMALALALSNSPIQNTYAYSRATTPGIPPGEGVAASQRSAVSTAHFIYIVVLKGTTPSMCAVWLKGTYYAATLQKVTSPVTIDSNPAVPTGRRETLVPQTESDVYQVSLADPRPWAANTDTERLLTRDNEVVVFVQANGTTWHGTVKTIQPLRSVPGR